MTIGVFILAVNFGIRMQKILAVVGWNGTLANPVAWGCVLAYLKSN
jgi:hypothetical protein